MAPLPGFVNDTHVAQIFRVTRERTDAWQGGIGETSIEHASAITPVPAERASPEQFPAWNREHWSVEANHNVRDRTFDEDTCLARNGFAPENSALRTNIALAMIIHKTAFDSFASATRYCALKREDTFDAILSP